MPPQSQPNSPYDFIMQSPEQPKKSLLPRGGSMAQRILIVILGLTVLVIIFAVVASFLGSGNEKQRAGLLAIAQKQAAIINLCELGADKAKAQDTRAFALTTKLSLSSSNQETKAALQKYGVKATDKRLVIGTDTKTEESLTVAEQNNRFDETFAQLLTASLTAYQKLVKDTYDTTSAANDKQILAETFRQTDLLLGSSKNGS